MKIQFGQFSLDIDLDKTKDFYKNMGNVSDACSCLGCINYEKAVDTLPKEIISFFTSIGIDMKKITEVYAMTTNPDSTVLYGGFYHLCGAILQGEDAYVNGMWDYSKAYTISKDFYISFREKCDLVEEGFPKPVIQLEIVANIPWVLEETNVY